MNSALFADRRQKRIREQLRDAIAEVREREEGIERDKRTRSIRPYLDVDEVEALLEHIGALEQRTEEGVI